MGDGSFLPPLPFEAPVANAILPGDFDGDGKLDLALGLDDDMVAIRIGKGDGTFLLAPHIQVSGGTENPIVADFNQDGIADLAMSGYSHKAPFVSILLGNGDGTFRPGTSFSLGGSFSESALVASDFTSDGRLDLGVAFETSGTGVVLVFPGNGDGTLDAPFKTEVSGYPKDVTDTDFNLDGRPDLVVYIAYSQQAGQRKLITSFSDKETARLLNRSTRWRRRKELWPSATSPATACRTSPSAEAAVRAAGSTSSPGKGTGASIPQSELLVSSREGRLFSCPASSTAMATRTWLHSMATGSC